VLGTLINKTKMDNYVNAFEFNENFFFKNFFFEELWVKILFLKNFPKINLITHSFGPFKKGTIKNIKIWIAFLLKKINWCSFKKPFWLKDSFLENKILMERKKNIIQPLPYYYFEFNLIFYSNLRKNFSFSEKTFILIKELCCIRLIKLGKNLESLTGSVKLITLEKICSFEFLFLKKFIQTALYFCNYI
jgi:hypothetical protein